MRCRLIWRSQVKPRSGGPEPQPQVETRAASEGAPARYFFEDDDALALPAASFGEGADALPWSPITLFNGQTPKAGHFLQPTAIAMGQSVMVGLLGTMQ